MLDSQPTCPLLLAAIFVNPGCAEAISAACSCSSCHERMDSRRTDSGICEERNTSTGQTQTELTASAGCCSVAPALLGLAAAAASFSGAALTGGAASGRSSACTESKGVGHSKPGVVTSRCRFTGACKRRMSVTATHPDPPPRSPPRSRCCPIPAGHQVGAARAGAGPGSCASSASARHSAFTQRNKAGTANLLALVPNRPDAHCKVLTAGCRDHSLPLLLLQHARHVQGAVELVGAPSFVVEFADATGTACRQVTDKTSTRTLLGEEHAGRSQSPGLRWRATAARSRPPGSHTSVNPETTGAAPVAALRAPVQPPCRTSS